jgi:serine/threonine protein kinase
LYLSPERIDEEDYDYKSDVWSLGILMHQLVSRDLYPFNAKSLKNIVHISKAIESNNRKQFPSQISQDFSTLIWKMLEVDPSK